MMNRNFALVFSTALIAVLVFASGCGRSHRRRTTTVYTPPPVTHVPQPAPGAPSASGCQYVGAPRIVCDKSLTKRFCYALVFCGGANHFLFCPAVPKIGGDPSAGGESFGCPSTDECAAAPDVLSPVTHSRCDGGALSVGSGGSSNRPKRDYREHDIDNKK